MMRRMLAQWLDDGLRGLMRNAGTLIVGNAMQSCIGLVSLAVTARALGSADFGRLIVAVAYGAIISQLIGFQSWQAVIRYGAMALAKSDNRQFMGLVKSGVMLDVLAALLASLVAFAGVMFGADLIGIDAASRSVATLVCLGMLANVVGTPTALLRIFDRYRMFVVQSFLTSLLKLILVGIAALSGGDLWAFALAWVSSQVFGYVLLATLAFRELARRKVTADGALSIPETFRTHPDLAQFFLFTNLNSAAKTLRDLDVPLLAYMLGPSATGSFKIARQVAGSLNKIIDPFFAAIYPDLAKLHSAGNTRAALSLVRRSAISLGVVATGVLCVFSLVGEPVLVLVLGEDFRSAYAVTMWCIVAAAIWAFAQPIAPMLMVYGRHSALFGINVVTTCVYLAALVAAARFFGLASVGMAFAGYLLLWALLSLQLLLRTAARHSGELQDPRTKNV